MLLPVSLQSKTTSNQLMRKFRRHLADCSIVAPHCSQPILPASAIVKRDCKQRLPISARACSILEIQ
jgi:hypothetical protein